MTRRDGEEDDAPGPPVRRVVSRNLSVVADEMRASLREVGIDLDDEKPKPAVAPSRSESDANRRAAIRALLEPIGAPEWIIESCPSLDLAIAYAEKHPKE